MYILYGSLLCMLLLAIGLLILFYSKNKHLFSFSKFLLLCSLMSIFSLGIYFLTRNTDQLGRWYLYGKKQYQFLMDYERLGGIRGMIAKMRTTLEDNPNDAHGWVILGKLYLAQLDYVPAQESFKKALALDPNNAQVKHYLDIANEPYKYLPIG